MTLRINVNVPPRLIERAREQQVERRLVKAAEQRQAVVRKEAARQVALQRLATGKDAKGNDVRGGTLDDQRRRWFGAGTLLKYYAIGGCVFNRKSEQVETLLNRDAKMYNFAEARLSVDYSKTYTPPPPGDYYWWRGYKETVIEESDTTDRLYSSQEMLLPAGRDAVLLYKPKSFTRTVITKSSYTLDPSLESVPGYATWPRTIIATARSHSAPLQAHGYDRAFIVASNRFREIKVPSNLGQAVDLLRGPLQSYGLANGAATAAVYESNSAATSQENGGVGICDDTTGAESIRFFYSRSTTPESGLPVGVQYNLDTERYEWSNQSDRRLIPKSVVPKHGNAADDFRFVWDSDRPDFCREQLLSLGFSPEDLIP